MPTSRSRFVLIFILLSGLILRLGSLNDPVTYDEAYTYVAFASRSLWAVISDYSLPNNHVFHSLLVHFSVQIFGNHPWSIRLPALAAGMGIIWVAYLFGRALYSRETGWVAAALAAYFPELIHFSTDARGYSLLGLFTLLIFWLGWRLTRRAVLREWGLLALCTALGFWSIPLMLYPAGALYLWLFLEGMSAPGATQRTRGAFFRQWLLSGLGAGALTVALYTPVLLVSGWRRLLANGFVLPQEAGEYFDWILWRRLSATWSIWTREVPLALIVLLICGLVLSLAWHWRIKTTRWPLALVVLGWLALLVIFRRPDAYDRFWSWLIAPLLLWAAAGLVETSRAIPFPAFLERGNKATGKTQPAVPVTPATGRLFPAFLTGLALVGLLAALVVASPTFPEKWAKMGNPQASALYLRDNLQPGEVAVVGYPNNAPVWYYLGLYGVPETVWQARGAFTRAYVLVTANQDQSLAGVLKANALDPADFALEHATGLMRYGQILIYRVEKR
jgi:hypothetical protein